MKAVTVRLDDGGLDGLLKRVRVGQELGFDRFDLCIANPQAALGRIVQALKEHKVSLSGLRLMEPRHSALVLRRPGYAKAGARDVKLAERSAEMIVETALALAPAGPQHLIIEGGFLNVPGLQDRQLQLDELLDCEDCEATRLAEAAKITLVDRALVDEQLDNFCRGLHAVCRKLAPLQVCLLTPDSPFGLLAPERLSLVLEDLKDERLGYWHNTASAAILRKLGGPAEQVWIERFATRLRGVYLADTLGGHGEQAPGLGEIDFRRLAPELAANTVRVLVVDDDKGTKLRFGTDYLSKVGIF